IGALNWTPVRSRRETAGKSHDRLTSGKHPQQ
ncbi:NADH-quinone oxidoreductase subunit A, partial [Proteus mirabilis]|nr:NADH-quinone oxidoreductase subunit A [Proteus mirabilis]